MRGLALVGALILAGVWAEVASACSCIREHPANRLAKSTAGALVGVVESRETLQSGSQIRYVIRVERALKVELPERVTLTSNLTSCGPLGLELRARVGLFLPGDSPAGLTACDAVDPDELLAAAELTPPRGSARLVAAVDADGLDAVGLGATGRPAGYAPRQGKPLAVARCGAGVVQAMRGADGKVHIFTRGARLATAATHVLPLRDVSALGCTDGGRTRWAIGDDGGRQLLLAIRDGKVQRSMRRAASAVAIVGPRAYFAHPGGLFRVVPLTGDRQLRASRHQGEFAQFSVNGGRVVGRLRDGRGAVLDLGSGRFLTGRAAGPLSWLTRDRVLDAAGGAVLDARLRRVRGVDVSGDLLAVEAGAAYFGDGASVRRLAPGASRLRPFATLPGEVVALTSVRLTAPATWHSCEKSAKLPLTT